MSLWFDQKQQAEDRLRARRHRRWVQLFIAVAATTIIGSGVVVWRQFATTARRDAATLVRSIAEAKGEAIRAHLDRMEADARLIAERDEVRLAVDVTQPPTLRDAASRQALDQMTRTVRAHGYHDLHLLDAEARIVRRVEPQAISPRIAARIAEVIRTGEPLLVGSHRGHDGRLEYGVAVPIRRTSDGPTIGAVFVEANVDRWLVRELLTVTAARETIESILLERREAETALIWASGLPGGDTTTRTFPRADTSRAGLNAFDGRRVGEAIAYDGTEVLAAALPIDGTPWVVGIQVDTAEIDRPAVLFGALIGVICLLVGGIATAGWRTLWLRGSRDLLQQRETTARQALRVVETSNDGFLAVERRGRIVAVNAATEAIWGRAGTALVGHDLTELLADDEADAVRAMLSEVVEGGRLRRMTRWETRDGRILDLDLSASFSATDDRIFLFLRDVSTLSVTQQRLQRLNRLYVFLQHASEGIYQSQTPDEAYTATCEIAVSHGGFAFAFLAQADPTGTVRPTTWAGPAESTLISQLTITLDPALATSHGPTARALRSGSAVVVDDVANDPQMAAWRALADHHEIRAAAAIPIRSEGSLVGALTLYAREPHFFEPETVAVLEDLTRILGLVLQSLAADAQTSREIERRQRSEESLRRLFKSSPLPLYVMEAATGRTTRVNRAFTDVFGFTLTDVPTCEAFLDRFRTDAASVEPPVAVMRRLLAGLDDQGATIRTPDLAIVSADGRLRWVEGFVTRIADEVVIAWVDLTELRTNQARAREAQRIARLAPWEYDFVTGTAHRASDFFEALGLPVEERQRQDPRLFGWLHPDDVVPTLDALVASLSARTACEVTARVTVRGGGLHYVRIRATGEFEGDRLVRAAGSAQNVTSEMHAAEEIARYRDQLEERVAERTEELARANARLQMTDRRLQAMLEMTQRASDLEETDIFQLGVDEATRLTGSGSGTLAIVTQERPVILGESWSAGMVPLDGEEDPWHQAITEGAPILTTADATHERHSLCVPIFDGNRIRLILTVADKATPYDDSDTQELRLIGHDVWQIVQQRRADAALGEAFARVQQSDQRFAAAMEASSEGIWEWELGARRITFSDVYHRLLGYEPGTLPTEQDGWITLVHAEDRDKVTSQLAELLRIREAVDIEFRMRRRDGEERWMLARGKVVEQDEKGAPRRVVGTLRDVTNRRALEDSLRASKAEAEEASRAKSAFLAVMSHEIRTPLNGVIGMAEILSQSDLPPREADAVRTIRASASTLLALLDDILDFSKIEAGRLALDLTEVAIESLVEDVVRALEPEAARRHVEFSIFLAPDLPRTIQTDPVRVRQILYNLLGNAVKFSGGHSEILGRVELRVERDPSATDRLRLRVIDNGIGMSAETVARLFTTFTQGESSTTRRFGGTGLGLAICKRITDLLHGEITVESTLGAGTCFTVILPMQALHAAATDPLPDLRDLRCILVAPRGERHTTEDASTYLRLAGADVLVVTSPEAGVVEARAHQGISVIVAWPSQERAPETRVDDPRIRTVHIVHGRRRQPRQLEERLVTLDRQGVRRRTLVQAVAIAAGRAAGTLVPESSEGTRLPTVVAPSISDARATGTLILVAEDDEVNQKVILRQLELVGCAAEVASNGVEALRLWRSGHYAMVITDLHMPEMDGYALAEAIRREEDPSARIPILALTANALRGEDLRAKAAGIDEYLTKPIRLDLLRQMIRHWMPMAIEPLSAPHPVGATSWSDPSLSVLDLDVATSMVGSDPATLREFLTEFRTHCQASVVAIHVAHDDGDLPEIARLAHKLKSSARAMGALALGECCAELETVAKRVDAPAVTELIGRLARAMTALETRLTAELGVPPVAPPSQTP